MSELRKSLTGRWVIVSPERAHRPNAFRSYPTVTDPKETCPFCVGNEHLTPPPVLTYKGQAPAGGAQPPWGVRVIPNRFPALRIEGTLDKRSDGIYDKMQGIGAHEIIVETPDHEISTAQFPLNQLADVMSAYRDRMFDLFRDRRFRYVLAFKNFGPAAGATLSHAHSQLIALPIVPIQIERELAGAEHYYEFRDRCYFCDMISQELADPRRLIVQNGEFLAHAPFASRFPFETHIIPKKHASFFWDMTREQMESFSEVLRDVLRRFKLALKNPPYSYIIHSTPPDHRNPDRFHWHIELTPKLTEVGGFEWGSGFYINPTPPEEAAEYLRELEQVMDVPSGHLLPTTKVSGYGK